MRTLYFLAAGLILAAIVTWAIKPANHRKASILFVIAWAGVTAWNWATGMSHGYSFMEELPIQMVIFAVPVLGLWLLSRLRSRGSRL